MRYDRRYNTLTICSNITQGSSTVILDIGVQRVEKFDQNRDGAHIYEALSVLVWTGTQSIGHETDLGTIPHLGMSNSATQQLHCVELAYSPDEQASGAM